MNAVFRLGNNVLNLIDPHVAGITCFETTAGSKSHIVDCEYDRTEKRQIVFIERTIDKYVLSKPGGILLTGAVGLWRRLCPIATRQNPLVLGRACWALGTILRVPRDSANGIFDSLLASARRFIGK